MLVASLYGSLEIRGIAQVQEKTESKTNNELLALQITATYIKFQ